MFNLKLQFVFVLLVIHLSINTSPSHAFLNDQCNDLRASIATQQGKYERHWDQYQTAFGRWQELTDAYKKFDNPVAVNRLRMTLNQASRMLAQLKMSPKCLKPYSLKQITAEQTQIRSAIQDLNGNKGFALMRNYLPQPINYLRHIK